MSSGCSPAGAAAVSAGATVLDEIGHVNVIISRCSAGAAPLCPSAAPPASDVGRGAGLRQTDAYLPDDYRTPFSDDLAQRAGPIDLPARHHRLPGEARTIIGNDLIACHTEAAHL